MSWNYRILKRKTFLRAYDDVKNTVEEIDTGTEFFVGEVYYDEDGKPVGWCEASAPIGETLFEAKNDFSLMGKAFDKPILISDGEGNLSEYRPDETERMLDEIEEAEEDDGE